MKNISLFLFSLSFCFAATCFAQHSDVILSDRAANTLHPYTVGKNVIQAQAGFSQFQSKRNQSLNYYTVGVFSSAYGKTINGDLKLRYGLTERFEIIGMGGAIIDRNNPYDQPSYSEPIFGLGFRANLYEGDGAIPAIGFEGLAWQSFGFTDFDFTLALRSNFTDRFAVGANASWRLDQRLLFTLKPEFIIKPGFGVFAEGVYGRYNSAWTVSEGNFADSDELAAGFGVYCSVGQNFLIDGSIGSVVIPTDDQYDVLPWYFDVGVSYRVDWRN